jgi:hypothetical protein
MEFQPQRLDLRPMCRHSDKCRTVVRIVPPRFPKIEWIVAGESQIRFVDDGRVAHLLAYLDAATDLEHDSAWILQLPIVGLALRDVHYGTTRLYGWIEADDLGDFRVPRAGYDPRQHPEVRPCNVEWCEGPAGHPMVPEHMPPPNADLHHSMKGRLIEIDIGPANHKGDQE